MNIPTPEDGWYDLFNGIRIPDAGFCSSFEELVSEVLKKKISMGIRIGTQSEEEIGIKDRMCGSGRIDCRGRSGCC